MSFCLFRRLLEHVLRGVILNVIEGFGFPHWTPIEFQMRWLKVQSNRIFVFQSSLETCRGPNGIRL